MSAPQTVVKVARLEETTDVARRRDSQVFLDARPHIGKLLFVFVVGISVGFLLNRPKPNPKPLDLSSDIVVIRSNLPAEVSKTFHVHNYSLDGNSTVVSDPSPDKDVWLIELGGGRVRIAATATSLSEQK